MKLEQKLEWRRDLLEARRNERTFRLAQSDQTGKKTTRGSLPLRSKQFNKGLCRTCKQNPFAVQESSRIKPLKQKHGYLGEPTIINRFW